MKNKELVCIRDSYTFYRRFYKESIPNCDYKNGLLVYLDIVNGFMKFISSKLLNGFDINLPARMGVIFIRGRKVKPVIDKNGEIKGIAPNWGATKKLQASDPIAKEKKTIVYCFNEHSNGISYRLLWSKSTVLVTNKTLYGMSFSRWNRRELSRLITEENKEYLIRK